MSITENENFESLWTDFATLVKGKLISTSAKQKLSTPLANLILSNVASSWDSDYEIRGKWLNSLKVIDPKRSELIGEVLLNDMHFDEIETKGEIPSYYNYIIPAAGACVGIAISMYLDCSKFIQTISTIVPAVLLYPAISTFRKRANETRNEELVEVYIAQLEKYKNSIIAILS